jgi:hypothetical protein
LAGLSGDDPVLGGRLGRGHRAAQPATAITPRHRPPRRGTRPGLPGQPAAAPRRRLRAALWSRAAGRPAQAADGHHRHLERATVAARPASWLADGHGPSAGFASSAAAAPPGHTAALSEAPTPAQLERSSALIAGLRDDRTVSQLR